MKTILTVSLLLVLSLSLYARQPYHDDALFTSARTTVSDPVASPTVEEAPVSVRATRVDTPAHASVPALPSRVERTVSTFDENHCGLKQMQDLSEQLGRYRRDVNNNDDYQGPPTTPNMNYVYTHSGDMNETSYVPPKIHRPWESGHRDYERRDYGNDRNRWEPRRDRDDRQNRYEHREYRHEPRYEHREYQRPYVAPYRHEDRRQIVHNEQAVIEQRHAAEATRVRLQNINRQRVEAHRPAPAPRPVTSTPRPTPTPSPVTSPATSPAPRSAQHTNRSGGADGTNPSGHGNANGSNNPNSKH